MRHAIAGPTEARDAPRIAYQHWTGLSIPGESGIDEYGLCDIYFCSACGERVDDFKGRKSGAGDTWCS